MKGYARPWEERERGWGRQPYGWSLHESLEDMEAYIKAYWADMPDQAPDYYLTPVGVPIDIFVPPVYQEDLKASKNGIQIFSLSGEE